MRWHIHLAWLLIGTSQVAFGEPLPANVQAAQEQLRNELHTAYPDVTSWSLTPMVGEKQAAALSAAGEVRVTSTLLGRRSAVELAWQVDGRKGKGTLWFAVEGLRPALSLASDIRSGAAIPAPSIYMSETGAWDPGCTPLIATAAVEGMRVRKALQAGDLLCAQDLEPKPPVSKGEQVLVHSTAGRVTVVSKGVAEQDGALGDALRVRNPTNGERYMAWVSAEGEVVVR